MVDEMPVRDEYAGSTPGDADEWTPEAAASPGGEPGQNAWTAEAAVDDLAGRFDNVERQLAEFHRRSAHREQIIDRLHEETQRLRGGIGRTILEPVIADLIRLYDQVDREVRRLRAEGQDAQLLWSFADDISQILDRCGIDLYTAATGDPFDRDRHRPLAVVTCTEESWHNTVAEVIAAGFAERETGRVRRPVQARFYQYVQDREPMHDDGAAEPQ